ncbi:MAG: ABC transporter permease [Propylenella sp.]
MRLLARNRDIVLALVIVALIALFTLIRPTYATPANLRVIFNDTSILIILALGQMIVILSRCIDLSVASNLALTGMIVAMINSTYPEFPVLLLPLVAAAAGLLLGAFNGFFVWKVGIPPIVVTLGTLAIYRGLIFIVSGGGKWINAHEMSAGFLLLPRTVVLGLPLLSWTAIAFAIAVYLFIRFTRAGRSFHAVGGNPVAAVYAGLDVGRTQFAAFCISGAFAGLCGYLWISRYAIAYTEIAAGFELQVVAACVIGGASIAGGIGTVPGVVLGALFIGVINNALPVIHISPFWQNAISGAAIIAAVVINARQERRGGRLILRESHVGA